MSDSRENTSAFPCDVQRIREEHYYKNGARGHGHWSRMHCKVSKEQPPKGKPEAKGHKEKEGLQSKRLPNPLLLLLLPLAHTMRYAAGTTQHRGPHEPTA
eukprot:1160228-Pelagomonas_calceolata.AAC.8